MKFILLHGTGSNSKQNWFPWLKAELEGQGHNVWVPDLPEAQIPNPTLWTPYILENCPFAIDDQTVVIGHSAGAVEILHLLQVLETPIHGAIPIGSFNFPLNRDYLVHLFDESFDFVKIKHNGGHIIFLHSDNDPSCPLEGAQDLAAKLGAKIVVLPGLKHFSYGDDPRFTVLPEILPLVQEVIS
jgi:predicted alpha/beta hydrolase family esterase